MLGTNDAKHNNWNNPALNAATQYQRDYATMIANFKQAGARQVFIMIPPPLYMDGVYGMNQTVINTVFPPSVKQIASQNQLPPPIDLFSLFQSHCPVVAGTPGHPANASDVYCDWVGSGGKDACHPDDIGYLKLAEAVKKTIDPSASAL
jgi:lysophospholipase L1-like esterase